MARLYPLSFRASLTLMLGLLALFIYNAPGTGDFRVWLYWMNLLDQQGFYKTLVQINDNYPPFSLMILDALLHLSHWTGLTSFFWLKMSMFLGLFGTTALFYAWTRHLGLTVGLYLTLLVNVGCGYVDVYWSVTLIAALWALHRNHFGFAAGLYTLSVMTKPQPMLAAPFLALYVLNICSLRELSRLAWRRIGAALAGSLGVLGAFAASLGQAAFLPLVNAMDTFGHRDYVNATPSGNAMNVNWILTHALHVWRPAEFGPLDQGTANFIPSIGVAWQLPFKGIFAVLFVFLLYRFFRREKTMHALLLYSALGALTCFMFNTGMHENHLYVVPLLTVGLAAMDERYWAFHSLWAMAAVMNLTVFYGIGGAGLGYSRVVGIDLPLLFSMAFTLLYFLSMGWVFVPDEQSETPTIPSGAAGV